MPIQNTENTPTYKAGLVQLKAAAIAGVTSVERGQLVTALAVENNAPLTDEQKVALGNGLSIDHIEAVFNALKFVYESADPIEKFQLED